MRHPQPYHSDPIYYVPFNEKTVLPDQVILDLNEFFLKTGSHSLSVSTIQYGRQLICDLMKSIRYYQSIGYVSFDMNVSYPNNLYHNVHKLLIDCGYLSDDDFDFNQFVLDSFLFDFLIIEYTELLEKQKWYTTFVQLLYEHSIDRLIPIVIMQARD